MENITWCHYFPVDHVSSYGRIDWLSLIPKRYTRKISVLSRVCNFAHLGTFHLYLPTVTMPENLNPNPKPLDLQAKSVVIRSNPNPTDHNSSTKCDPCLICKGQKVSMWYSQKNWKNGSTEQNILRQQQSKTNY